MSKARPATTPLRSEAVVQRQTIKILRAFGVDVARRNTRTFTVPGKGGRPRPMFCGKIVAPTILA